MKFQKVDSLPVKARRKYKKLEDELEKFMKMDVKYAKVDYGDEYSSPESARVCISKAIELYQLPLKVCVINGVVYLESADM
jgi:hypothetical protein